MVKKISGIIFIVMLIIGLCFPISSKATDENIDDLFITGETFITKGEEGRY